MENANTLTPKTLNKIKTKVFDCYFMKEIVIYAEKKNIFFYYCKMSLHRHENRRSTTV